MTDLGRTPDGWEMYERAVARNMALSGLLSDLEGHMMNAIIDLETGTKADAKRTLDAGLKLAKEFMEPLRKLADEIRGKAQ